MSVNNVPKPSCPSCLGSTAFKHAEEILSLEDAVDQMTLFIRSAPISEEHRRICGQVLKSMINRLDISRKRLQALKDRYPQHQISHPSKGELSELEARFRVPLQKRGSHVE